MYLLNFFAASVSQFYIIDDAIVCKKCVMVGEITLFNYVI